MKQSIGSAQFQDAFRNYNRADNFSREGLRKLFEYLEEYEESTGEEIELDVIALCCDYNEISIKDVEHETGVKIEDLGDHTTVIEVDDETIIYQSF